MSGLYAIGDAVKRPRVSARTVGYFSAMRMFSMPSANLRSVGFRIGRSAAGALFGTIIPKEIASTIRNPCERALSARNRSENRSAARAVEIHQRHSLGIVDPHRMGDGTECG
jgi:hypothetical protein